MKYKADLALQLKQGAACSLKSLSPDVGPCTDSEGSLSGYASVFNIEDDQGDIIRPGAFQASLNRWQECGSSPKFLWQHNPAELVGVWEALWEDDLGLRASGRLLLEVARGRDAHALLKLGAVDHLSIGYRINHFDYDPVTKTRILYEVDLVEISLVTYPANPKAKVHVWKGNV